MHKVRSIAVTGGTGSRGRGLGPVVIDRLRLQGYRCISLDVTPPDEVSGDFRQVDLTRYGDTFAALHDVDAVVHLAAMVDPEFDHLTGAARFHTNTLAAYNVFQAATTLGIGKVVWASSETVLGFPFDRHPPEILPTNDEDPPRPQLSYAYSKAVTEDLARYMAQRFDTVFIGLRFSHIFYDQPGHPTGYDTLPRYWSDCFSRSANLWAYVDCRDAAQAVAKAVEADLQHAEVMTIAAADTIMPQTNAELIRIVFPNTRLRPEIGPHETLISIEKAKRLLNYQPAFSWRSLGKYR